MRRRRLFWILLGSFVVLTLGTMLTLVWIGSRTLRTFHYERTERELERQTQLVRSELESLLREGKNQRIADYCNQYGRLTDLRLTVILPGGLVVGDSHENPLTMDNHADRDEVLQARGGTVGRAERFSKTLQMPMFYIARPLIHEGELIGVIRVAKPSQQIHQDLIGSYLRIALAGGLVALLAALISWALSARISRTINQIKLGAERFASGDLNHLLQVPRLAELAELAEAMNRMAVQLEERIGEEVRQRNEQEAMLASMGEGVLAIDVDERLLHVNLSAMGMLGITANDLLGRSIEEVVRNTDLQAFVRRALAAVDPVESDITINNTRRQLALQARGTILRDAQGRGIGVLVVLRDLTRLRQLEGMRRDFVANVSHELRTPITSIKGFAETLLDGDINDTDTLRHFVGIIVREANHLNTLIEDLLSLARLEQAEKTEGLELHEQSVRTVLLEAVEALQVAIRNQKTPVEIDCAEHLRTAMNASLVKQAVVNLVDNAIKYSEPGTPVTVRAFDQAGEILIQVADRGPGIDPVHLPRLFERFYRVDKARSRKLGGTGLGLAIVKHICQAHGGRIGVESIQGEGSTFTLALPRTLEARPSQSDTLRSEATLDFRQGD